MRKLGFILAAIALSSSAVSAAPPVLGVSPTYMEFTAYEGGANPEPNILSIWRDGGNGPLWWDVIEDCNWIVVEPNSGKSMGEVDDCNVIIDISSLAGGIYSCQLTVDAGTAANSPQIVDVNLTVIGPDLQISQTYFDFTAYEGGANPNDQILTITNTGGGTLNWQVTKDCNWLSAEPNSGSSTGEADDANLSIDITGLTGGIYNCQLTVSDPNASNSPQFVDVNLVIQPWAGSGTPNDPYRIWDACDMQAIGFESSYWDAHFRLMDDIDLSAYYCRRIGNSSSSAFTGSFDGNGHSITNFKCMLSHSYLGVFGYVNSGGIIKNIILINPDVDARCPGVNLSYVGSLVGRLVDGQVENCRAENVMVTGSGVGLTGAMGGLVGGLGTYGRIVNCSTSGVVSGNFYVGGLVGHSYGEINLSHSSCFVTVLSGDYAGGLAGATGINNVSECYSTGAVEGDEYVGGLIGYADNNIISCYSTANVTGTNRVGGLVGHKWRGLIMSDCYAQGSVAGTSYVGGLVGELRYGDVMRAYSTGPVTGENNAGGLVGYKYSTPTVTSSFWDIDSSGQTTSDGGIGLPTSEMQTESTFTDAGWDFVGEIINGPNDIWKIYEGEDYPRLAWQKYGGGIGTEVNPYLIFTSFEMNDIGANPNDWDAHFKLMSDIDLGGYTGTQFSIIGSSGNPFTGVFDGDEHTISNFTYKVPAGYHIGLFGALSGNNAEIKNLGLIDPNVKGRQPVGSLIGSCYNGSVTDCYVIGGKVSGRHKVGGLIGWKYEGGLSSIISGCSFIGSVEASSTHIGGLVGLNDGEIRESHTAASVSGSGWVGGLVGYNNDSAAVIDRCYCSGSVSGGSDIGGLVGRNGVSASIENSYSSTSVSGDDNIGGLVGYNWLNGFISHCYATGGLSSTGNMGGFIGYDNTGSYTKCFWDSSVNPDVNGIGNKTDPNVIGETTANMQTESTFTDAGWDFVGEVINGPNDFWDICEGTNYPKFVWQIPVGDFICPDGVTMVDYSVLAYAWMSDPNDYNWDPNCDISEPNDNVIDERDVMVFTDNWLEGI
ncbi:MAG: GLUG motif-containing protein [Planctomycetota bacterium]